MNSQIAIGVDVGGSHIISAAVDLTSLQIIPKTTFSSKINNKASKEVILSDWSKVINQSIQSLSEIKIDKIGFAMPGPFQYRIGKAMFETNDKYENLYNVNVAIELKKYIQGSDLKIRFLNDATSFGVGVSAMGEAKDNSKIIAITLGTGFGSSFIKDGVPQVNSDDVPEGGCLWDKPCLEGMADDYFSTRWFIKRYLELSKENLKGVKEIAEADDSYSKEVFSDFSKNLANFMSPILQKYQPNMIVLGGNISNASRLFLPQLKDELKQRNLDTKFIISSLMEEAAIIGSAKLFDPFFWDQVKDDLPES